MFHHESRRPIAFGVKRSKVKVTRDENIVGMNHGDLVSARFSSFSSVSDASSTAHVKPNFGKTRRVFKMRRVWWTVNTVNAGQGDLEITVNGGSVPCNVQPRGNRLLHASFTPRVAVPHDIEVWFNGQEVTGMSFRFNAVYTALPLGLPAFL